MTLAEYLAARERALDWLAFVRRVAACGAPQLLTPSLVPNALKLARNGCLSAKLAPRDKTPLRLP